MGIPVAGTYTIIDKYSSKTPKSDQGWELEQVMAVLQKHGLTDLSGLKTVYEDAINDTDDIAAVVKNFRRAFPGIQELVVPDVADLQELAPRLLSSNLPFKSKPNNPITTIVGRVN